MKHLVTLVAAYLLLAVSLLLVALLLSLIFPSWAHADVRLRSGSWGYEDYPVGQVVTRDGQPLALTGGQQFSFTGQIYDYWLGLGNCQPSNGCKPGQVSINFYSGTRFRGVGLWGNVKLRGDAYTAGTGNHLELWVYGAVTLPPLAKDGAHRIKTVTRQLRGSFTHDGVVEKVVGWALVTVEFEQRAGKWEVEALEYDVVTP